MTIYDPSDTEITEIVLPDGNTASEVIAPDGSTVFSANKIPDSVVSRWQLNEGSGTTATDSEGSNDGSITDGSYTTNAKEGSHALEFSGSGNVDTANTFKFATETGVFSAGGWCYVTDLDTTFSLLSNGEGGNGTWFRIYRDSSAGDIRFEVRVDGDSASAIYSSISENTWVHLTITYDGSTIRGFVDGIEEVSTSFSQTTTSEPDNTMQIGSRAGSDETIVGRVDDCFIANEALSASEIQELIDQAN